MSNAKFQMVKYHNQEYPNNIPLNIQEVACHFDIETLDVSMDYSLHTEYSYGIRKFSSFILCGLDEIKNSHKFNVPQLWKSKKWAEEFAIFITRLVNHNTPPKTIEIHPPFNDYTDDLLQFIERYKIFECIIKHKYPGTEILIENRCGSVYRGGKFILSKIDSLIMLSNLIDENNLKLKYAFDIPQLFTAHNCSLQKPELYFALLEKANHFCHNIGGVHLWGKKHSNTGRKVSHCGDLHSYFEENNEIINRFLQNFNSLFSDDVVRKLVLEVNSGNDHLRSIISDLQNAEVEFI